jgi:hypothetical protein
LNEYTPPAKETADSSAALRNDKKWGCGMTSEIATDEDREEAELSA